MGIRSSCIQQLGGCGIILCKEPGAGVALLFREFSQRFEEVGWAVYYRDVRLYDYDYDYFDPVNYRFARLVMPLYVAVGGGTMGCRDSWGFYLGFCGMGRISAGVK